MTRLEKFTDALMDLKRMRAGEGADILAEELLAEASNTWEQDGFTKVLGLFRDDRQPAPATRVFPYYFRGKKLNIASPDYIQ